MSWTSNLLVVAHQTIESDHLVQTLCGRARAGPIRVTLLVPAQGSRLSAARALERAVQRLEAADITVDAVVGHPDPIVALDDVWKPYRFDEVVVATLPDGRSRRVTLALANRVERFTGVLVTHIVAPVPQGHPILRVAA